MADFRIVVVVDPSQARRGARQVEQSLNRVGGSADRLRGLIAGAFAFSGIALATRQLVSLADTFTNIQNRLGTVTKSMAELTVVTIPGRLRLAGRLGSSSVRRDPESLAVERECVATFLEVDAEVLEPIVDQTVFAPRVVGLLAHWDQAESRISR